MFDPLLRPVKDRALTPVARGVRGVAPGYITGLGLALGLGAAWAAWTGAFGLGLLLWLGNRFMDGLDGLVARIRGTADDVGGYLDLMADFAVYAAVPVAMALRPGAAPGLAPAALFMLAVFYLNAASWMVPAALLEKRGLGADVQGESTSVTMPEGLVAGGETVLFYALFFLLPAHQLTLFALMAALTGLTVLQRLVWARRVFGRMEKAASGRRTRTLDSWIILFLLPTGLFLLPAGGWAGGSGALSAQTPGAEARVAGVVRAQGGDPLSDVEVIFEFRGENSRGTAAGGTPITAGTGRASAGTGRTPPAPGSTFAVPGSGFAGPGHTSTQAERAPITAGTGRASAGTGRTAAAPGIAFAAPGRTAAAPGIAFATPGRTSPAPETTLPSPGKAPTGPTEVSTRTDAAGAFRLAIPAGTGGTLVFRHPGYMEARAPVAPLAPGEEREVGITLARIYALDALSVVTRRQRPLLNTDDAETGGTVEAFEIRTLPTDARDPLRLAFNVPGVSQSTGFFGDAPPLVIHGDNALYTRYTLDGLDNDEGFLGGPRVVLPLSALERLNVHTAAYRPGLGRSTNGVVEMETRAGGEGWSGDLLLVNRPGTPLDADPRFAPAGVDPDGFQRTQLGGSLGGPLLPGRTFFFGAVELTDEKEDRIGSTARTSFLGTEERTTWKAFGRLDHGWSPTQSTTLRFALHNVRRKGKGGGVIVPEADITTRRLGSITGLTHRTAFREGRASNELSVQLSTFTWDFPPSASDLQTPQVTIVSPDLTTVEAVVGSSNFIFDESELQLQLKDEMEMRLGERHTLRIGADLVRSSFELLGANTNPRGAYTVVNEGNITPSGRFLSIRDVPSDVRVFRYTIDAQPQQVNLSQTLVGAFVEDRWRITPSLTAQFGLRWDYDDITSRGESDPDLDNFQPRLSVNWFATPRSVVRGGWGLYTGKFPYAVYSDAVQFGPDGNAVVTFEEGTAFPPPTLGQGPSAAEIQALEGGLPPREVRRMFARGLEQPYSSQLSLGYQRQLGRAWSVSVDGVWVESRNLPRSWDLNAPAYTLQPGDTLNRSPEFGDAYRPADPANTGYRRLTTTDSGGKGRYLGLQTTLRRALVDGFSLEGSWVVSRSRNDTEDINFNAVSGNDFEAEWADGINDRRHHVTLRGVWEPLDQLSLAGIFDFQTGTPVNRVAFFRDLDGSGPIFGNGFVGNHDRFPGVKRNAERLPNAWTLNGSLAWTPRVAGGTLALRVEGFNLLNRTNYTGFANGIPGGGPRTQVGRPGDPMVFTTAAPPRQVQLSARWAFGG